MSARIVFLYMKERHGDSIMNFDHFECLSFDCYGTLIDWETGISSALQPIFETHEVAADNHALLDLYGRAEGGADRPPTRRDLHTIEIGES